MLIDDDDIDIDDDETIGDDIDINIDVDMDVDDDDDAPAPKGKGSWEDKFKKSEKSRKHQQAGYSKLSASHKKLEEQVKKLTAGADERNKKLLEALGGGNPDDDEAKKIIAEYENDPVSFIQKAISSKLDERLPEIEQNINMTKMISVTKPIMEEIEAKYDVDFTSEFENKVASVLKGFDSKFRRDNPKKAILQATMIANGGLKKREENLVYIDRGKITTGKRKGGKSEGDLIKEGMKNASRKTAGLFD